MFNLGRKPFHRHLDEEKRETEFASDRKTFSPSGIAVTGTVSLQFTLQRNGDTVRSWAGNCFTHPRHENGQQRVGGNIVHARTSLGSKP